ncbi:MAG: tripartite AtP-independent periplasmic transporter subunit DctQ [Rhodoferax sp.]|nr:tripartite AtP-independent periplasmic transporter subunit DctQ [Rhodoferax sp.]
MAPVDADAFSPAEGPVERVTRWATQAAVVFLVVMMGIEMIARSALGWSLQVTNELGGYALIAITFLGLASGQADHAFHRVHMLDARLSATGKAALRLVFDLATLAVSAVLCAEFTRFLWITWASGDVAATSLVTPLWMPRLAMPIGMLALVITLLRTVAGDVRRLRAARLHRPAPGVRGAAL